MNSAIKFDQTTGLYSFIARNGKVRSSPNKHYIIDKFNTHGAGSLEQVSESVTQETVDEFKTDKDIYDDIKMRFETLDLMVQASLKGLNRSMIVSGPAGLGKSTGVMNALESAKCEFALIKGFITPKQLFTLLYRNKNQDNIIVFDDADCIFSDEVSLNLLKASCDSSDKRYITWLSSRGIADEDGEDVPSTFEFRGSIIFITNKDFNIEINKNHKASIHFEALRSRSHYVSLGIKTKRDYMIRIKQVIETTNMLDSYSDETKKEILGFIEDNQNKMIELSLRVVKKLADLTKISSNWRNLAKVSLMN